MIGLGSAAFSPFYCDKNPDGERPAFWKTGFWLRGCAGRRGTLDLGVRGARGASSTSASAGRRGPL